jgi:hypothetical protein
MSPARQPNGSRAKWKIARQTPTDPASKIQHRARAPSVVAKKKRAFDSHSFLATIGKGRKFIFVCQGANHLCARGSQ